MFNRLRSREAATISTVLALSLGITACGGSDSSKGTKQINQPLVGTKLEDSSVTITAQYFNDGTRKVSFSGDDYAPILEFCDGPDLVEETAVNANGNNGAAGNSLSRTINYPGCADGKLTASDFRLHSAAK